VAGTRPDTTAFDLFMLNFANEDWYAGVGEGTSGRVLNVYLKRPLKKHEAAEVARRFPKTILRYIVTGEFTAQGDQ
jgi:hypothetical protein